MPESVFYAVGKKSNAELRRHLNTFRSAMESLQQLLINANAIELGLFDNLLPLPE